jgi:hypothetical protein
MVVSKFGGETEIQSTYSPEKVLQLDSAKNKS